MIDRLTVRAAQLADLSVVVELRLALLREYADHPFYERLREDARDRAFELYRAQIASPHETIFLGERAGSVVGILRCVEVVASPLLLPDRYCYVSSVYVAPAMRGHGVLRAMVDAAERWCRERGLTEMRLNNSSDSATARGAWQACGFAVVEEVRRRVVAPAASVAAGTTSTTRARIEAR